MMGSSHAATGLLVGLATAPILGLTSTPEVLLYAATTAGYALAPDLDHPGARASRILGPVTGWLSYGLRCLSAWTYAKTAGPQDERCNGTHRHLTHTVAFAVVLGLLVALGSWRVGPWFVLGTVLFGVLLADNALGDWLLWVVGGVAVWLIAASDVVTALDHIGAWAGIAVALGCITHDLGDALTLSGCPFLWPIPIRGETWWEIRPPEALRFRTGGWFENAVVMPATMVGCLLLCPAVGTWLLNYLTTITA
jgi:membrane-bound metal-dependent hydrolase YbcI (DUF457 family)